MEEERNKICDHEGDPFSALSLINEREEDLDASEEDDLEDYDDYTLKFDVDMNSLGIMESPQDYETLAEKKRNAPRNHDTCDEESRKRLRQEDDENAASFEKLMELMNHGHRRRKSKKLKKRGRRKGSKKKLNPEITRKLGDATLHYARGNYTEAIVLLKEVILAAPHSDPFHTLGLVYKALGENKKAFDCYKIAAIMSPKDLSLWKLLVTWSIEQGNNVVAMHCLSKAISADPEDATLRFQYASLFIEAGNYKKAVESYDEIIKLCPHNPEAFKTAADLHEKCGHVDRSISILEDYLKNHVDEIDLSMVELLVSIGMKNNEHGRALQCIDQARENYGEELPFHLLVKGGICHVFLGNLKNAESIFTVFKPGCVADHVDLMNEVANAYMSVSLYDSALKYYMLLDELAEGQNGNLHLKIAQCYSSMNDKEQAIRFFYKAVSTLENNIDARLSLASHLLEYDKQDEAISVLSPPTDSKAVIETGSSDQFKAWWVDGKIKLMLANIYRAKRMDEEFVDSIFPLIRESLFIEIMNRRIKRKKRLPNSVLQERIDKVELNVQTDGVFQVKPIITNKPSESVKASRAKRLLEKRVIEKEEKKAAALAKGQIWQSDDESENEIQRDVKKEPPLPKFLKTEKHHQLIIDLSKALASLQRHWEALEIINLTLKLAHRILSIEIKKELQCLGAEIEYNITDSRHGYDYIRFIIQQRPYSIAAWNCYYKATSGLDNRNSKHSKFLRVARSQHKDCVPPIIISGHQHTIDSRHQAAARDYLHALKLMPESPLVNLCVGTSLINLALNFRLLNKHFCVAQGLAFLYNNVRLCGNSQEALYNIARAYHHVGLISLAASYYEKVLGICGNDYPVPELSKGNEKSGKNLAPGYCDVRREAAYNLHLIYKRSGAIDLARQVLKDHCSI